MVAVWYGVIPVAGIFYGRYKRGQFIRRFTDLGLSPLLDYRRYRQLENTASNEHRGEIFRFTGGIESITDGRILWVKGEDLTIPVSIEKTKCFLLPKYEGEGIPEVPEQIRWDRVSTLTEGAKVFVGGLIKMQDNRLNFISTKENPLVVIFYNCADEDLTGQIIRASKTGSEYWNIVTPASLAIGALSLIYIAASLLNRPAYRMNLIGALVAVFVPVLPMIPPGLLLTVLYRRVKWSAKKITAYREITRLPLRHLQPDQESALLSTGELYGYKKLNVLPQAAKEGSIPFLIPGAREEKTQEWYFFGVLEPEKNHTCEEDSGEDRPDENKNLPKRSKDPFVSFGILPANHVLTARRHAIKAYALEALSWLILLSGIAANAVFIMLILTLLTGL